MAQKPTKTPSPGGGGEDLREANLVISGNARLQSLYGGQASMSLGGCEVCVQVLASHQDSICVDDLDAHSRQAD